MGKSPNKQTVKAQDSASGYALFETAIGRLGITWSPRGVTGLYLPERTARETEKRLRGRTGLSAASSPPAAVRDAIKRIRSFLEGKPIDLSAIPIDFTGIPAFHRLVYEAARAIPAGTVTNYGRLAEHAGSPGAARAVGQALARNPVAVVIPCHRVVASGKKPGGFSAHGALETKARLLAIEGYTLFPPRKNGTNAEAAERLSKADPVLAGLIRRVGPFKLKPDGKQEPFHALLESILYQQITGKAAQTIAARLKNFFPHKQFPSPSELLSLSEEQLRAAGLSRNKAAAARDLAEKTLQGVVPALSAIKKMEDGEIIERLTAIRGIGRWTVEMFLIFNLGRPDILPVTDYGVRKGFALTYNLKDLPTPGELLKHGERWRPYRTAASWYLWRSLDYWDSPC